MGVGARNFLGKALRAFGDGSARRRVLKRSAVLILLEGILEKGSAFGNIQGSE